MSRHDFMKVFITRSDFTFPNSFFDCFLMTNTIFNRIMLLQFSFTCSIYQTNSHIQLESSKFFEFAILTRNTRNKFQLFHNKSNTFDKNILQIYSMKWQFNFDVNLVEISFNSFVVLRKRRKSFIKSDMAISVKYIWLKSLSLLPWCQKFIL